MSSAASSATGACGSADVFLQIAPDFDPVRHRTTPSRPRDGKARDWFARTLEYAAELRLRGTSRRCRASTSSGEPRRTPGDAAATSWPGACEQAQRPGHHVLRRGPRRLDRRRPRRRRSSWCASVPGLTLTLDYTHFTRAGLPDAEIEPLLVARASHFHVRGARTGRLQASFKDNTIDYGRVLDVHAQVGYPGYVGIEYVWIDWEHCNEGDNLSETILFRDFLRNLADSSLSLSGSSVPPFIEVAEHETAYSSGCR